MVLLGTIWCYSTTAAHQFFNYPNLSFTVSERTKGDKYAFFKLYSALLFEYTAVANVNKFVVHRQVKGHWAGATRSLGPRAQSAKASGDSPPKRIKTKWCQQFNIAFVGLNEVTLPNSIQPIPAKSTYQ